MFSPKPGDYELSDQKKKTWETLNYAPQIVPYINIESQVITVCIMYDMATNLPKGTEKSPTMDSQRVIL